MLHCGKPTARHFLLSERGSTCEIWPVVVRALPEIVGTVGVGSDSGPACCLHSEELLALAAATYFHKYVTSSFGFLPVWAVPNTSSVLALPPQSFVAAAWNLRHVPNEAPFLPSMCSIPPQLINPTVASSLRSCDFPHFIPLIQLKDISTFLTSSLVNSLLLMASASSFAGLLWFDITLTQKVLKTVYVLLWHTKMPKLCFSTAQVSRIERLSDLLKLCCHAVLLASTWYIAAKPEWEQDLCCFLFAYQRLILWQSARGFNEGGNSIIIQKHQVKSFIQWLVQKKKKNMQWSRTMCLQADF